MTKAKVLLVTPAASAGALTGLAFNYPPKDASELGLMMAILAPLYLVNLAVLGWMWRKPAGGLYLGFGRGTWSFLVGVAYAIGFGLMFAF
jgi:hypothetical protein